MTPHRWRDYSETAILIFHESTDHPLPRVCGAAFRRRKIPDDRPITNPKSLTSRANPNAAPIAIDELFYTRSVAGPSWSPDGREIVFTTNLTGRLNLWKVAADGGWPVQLSQSDDRETGAAWSPDGKWIAYQQDFGGGEYYDLFAIPSGGGEASYLTSTKDVSETLVDRASLRSTAIDFPPGVSVFAGELHLSPSGDRLTVSHQDSQRPSDLWIYDVRKTSSKQLTYSALGGLDPQRIPPSQLVHYRSFDGKTISAFVWLPDNLRQDGSNPGIVLPHGGPTGETVDSFDRTVAALASRGYVCIAPNVRGSTGYGMEFQQANHMDLGGGDLQDEVYAARFLTETGFVDPKRLGITGGSYGGYMTLMAIGKVPDLWAAAVEEYGIIDWFTMLQHEDARLQQYQRSLVGDPVTDRKVYEDDSPITFIRKAKAPLLVLQGDNDIRVPKEEAVQIVDILEKAGTVVSARYYPNEGHGFAKRENQVDAIQRTIEWFDRYLKGKQ